MPGSLEMAPNIEFIFENLRQRDGETLLASSSGETSGAQVLDRVENLMKSWARKGISTGSVCAFEGDYSPETVALFLALAGIGAVAVPFTANLHAERKSLEAIAGVEWWIDPKTGDAIRTEANSSDRHSLLRTLVEQGHPGLIVFTSGSTGKPKAILHDVDRVAAKFQARRRGWRMVLFLMMDHFGGFNTLMSVLAGDSVGVCLESRSVDSVCQAVEVAKADLLPTTPTFLGMLIASGLWKTYDLTSLRMVTYGAEPMPPATLAKMRDLLPAVDFKQTYGLSELGVLRSASPDPASLWLRVGGDGYETRVVDGQLHIRSSSAMLGYLNADTPISDDGWMNTGDLVEERDGLIRFLGRKSEVINVGGQKVLPIEVESVLLQASGVADAVVTGTPHLILGQAVVARVALTEPEESKALTERLRAHCRNHLQKYKVPLRFEIVELNSLTTARAKKNRSESERQA